jgi:hypothetical protein
MFVMSHGIGRGSAVARPVSRPGRDAHEGLNKLILFDKNQEVKEKIPYFV